MNTSIGCSSQLEINELVKKNSLPNRHIYMRFELPYTGYLFENGEESGFKSSLKGDHPVLLIDLNSGLAVPFFGKKFVEQYLQFIESGIL